MSRTAVAVAVGLCAAAAVGQPPAQRWVGDPYLAQVRQAANQLFYHVEQLRNLLTAQRAAQYQALLNETEAYYQNVLGFSRLLQRNPDRGRVAAEYQRLDAQGDRVVALARQLGGTLQSARLYQLAAQVEAADRTVGAAVYGGAGGGPPPANQVVRLTRALDAQADELLRVARQT